MSMQYGGIGRASDDAKSEGLQTLTTYSHEGRKP